MGEPAIRNTMDAAGVFLANAADRHAYINRKMTILDYNSNHKAAYEDGEQAGENRMGALVSVLLEGGKYAELARAGKDKEFRNQLLKQYGL